MSLDDLTNAITFCSIDYFVFLVYKCHERKTVPINRKTTALNDA